MVWAGIALSIGQMASSGDILFMKTLLFFETGVDL
jgi:hypothetical protein